MQCAMLSEFSRVDLFQGGDRAMRRRATSRTNVPQEGDKHTLVVRVPRRVWAYLREQGQARRTSMAGEVVRLVDEAIRREGTRHE